MKTKLSILLSFLALCFGGNTYTQPVFLDRFSGSGDGENVGTAITVDSSGNSYITGYTSGPVSGHDITTIKYGADGSLQWKAIYNGPGNSTDEGYAIAKDASGYIYVAGTSTGASSDKDMTLIKYGPDGAMMWMQRYTSSGSHPDVATCIVLDAAGNPIIGGYSYGNGGNQLTVIKYNPAGTQQWVKTGDGTSGTNGVNGIAVDNSSNIYVTGYTLASGNGNYKQFETVKYNSAGARQWIATSNGECTNTDGESNSIVTDGSGNSYITGYVITYSNGKDFVTIKYNTSGAQQWLKTYNGSANSDDIARKIIFASSGDVVVTGSSKSSTAANTEDYLTIKYKASDGTQQFLSRYDDPTAHNADIAYSVARYGDSTYYVIGSSKQSAAAGSEDIVVLSLRGNGTLRAKYHISNNGTDCGYDLATDYNGNLYITGFLAGLPTTHRVISNMVCAKYGTGSFMPGNITGVTNLETAPPNSFALNQNFPNPFNPSTTIRFDVGQASNVRISIYDVLGREVMTPVNEYMNQGSYEISLSMSSLASGLYFYRMTAGSYSEIRKLALTK